MSILLNLHEASFRGIPFLVPTESVSQGLKSVVHEFINSDERYIEEVGKVPPLFTLSCIISGINTPNELGSNSLDARFRFEEALNRGGFGKLVHPIYGALNVKVVGTYTISSSTRQAGQHVFNVTFGTSKSNINPLPKDVIVSNNTISDTSLKNFDNLNNFVTDNYSAPSTAYNKQQVGFYLQNRINDIISASNKIEGPISSILQVTLREFKKLQQTLYSIISYPFLVAESLTTMYLKLRELASTPAYYYKAIKSLIARVAPEYSSLKYDTSVRLENKKNLDTLIQYNNLAALSLLYESSVYTDFNTDLELIESKEIINDFYSYFFKEIDPPLSKDVRQAFNNLHNLFVKNYEFKEQNVWKTKTIYSDLSITLTTYKYFGNLDNLDFIIKLNPDKNLIAPVGEMTMITK